ncbi:zinc finger protein 420-like isoform X1 [Pseudophryne corroboree]|uniref:zinc finger protein 420-like isoform X1 n=2 Tax=Pseudophryne corroboree TaxID=495146 RepID=UPI003081D43E
MDKAKNHMTERILTLALELVYLLIEEDFVIVKKSGEHVVYSSSSQSPITEPPTDSLTQERDNEQKILDLTNKIIQLLTGEECEYLQSNKDFGELHKDHKKQEMGDSHQLNSQGISAGGIESAKSSPASAPVNLRKGRVASGSPHEISLSLYQGDTKQSVTTALREGGRLPEIYIHVPVDQTEYLSVCNKGDVASADSDKFSGNNICKPTSHTSTVPADSNESPVEEGKSTDLKPGEPEYTAIEIKEEPMEFEEENLSLNSQLQAEVGHLAIQAKSKLPLHDKSPKDTAHSTAQCTSAYIKQEPVSCEEGEHSETETSTSAQQQLLFAQLKEESCADGNSRDTETDVAMEQSHMQYRLCIKEEVCDDMYNEDHSLLPSSEGFSPAQSFHKLPMGEYYSAHSSTAQQGNNPEKPFSCLECGKCFKYKSLLLHHAKSHQKKPLICCDCGKRYSCKTEFDIHQRIHTGEKPFVCSDCGKGFRRKSHMLRHQRIHGDKETFYCPECTKCFHRLDVLNQHRKTHKTSFPAPELQMPMEPSQMQNSPTAYEEKEVFACTECGKCYNEISLLERHQRSHAGDKPFSCTECGKSFRFEALLELHWGSHIETISCPECGESFASQSLLSHHLKIHAGESECICSECGKEFPSRSQLADHYRTHTGEKPYMCPECGKHFRRKAHVVRHRKTHTGDKPFSCFECGKCFENEEFLSRHSKLHKRKRPHVCPECGKNYTKNSHLARHQRSHIRETTYTCFECGEYFQYPALLSQHMKTHSGKTVYECSECGKSCDSDISLAKHEKMHSKEKSFICVECGKSFTFYSHFMRHQTLHSGEKPFGCSECEKRFTRESHLVRHRRLHNSE